jgi:hypothetical protein
MKLMIVVFYAIPIALCVLIKQLYAILVNNLTMLLAIISVYHAFQDAKNATTVIIAILVMIHLSEPKISFVVAQAVNLLMEMFVLIA